MKLSELKPCAICGGALLRPPLATWHVLRVTQAMLKPQAANQTLGLMQFFGGNLGLAEAMSPDAEAVLIMGDQEPSLMIELHVCFDCWTGALLALASAVEKSGKAREAEEVPV